MADFCKDCSIAIFGRDFGEMAHLLPKDQYTEEMGALVLCECCGLIVVDYEGKRMEPQEYDPNCHCKEHVATMMEDLSTPKS